jgi:hypothetical protein
MLLERALSDEMSNRKIGQDQAVPHLSGMTTCSNGPTETETGFPRLGNQTATDSALPGESGTESCWNPTVAKTGVNNAVSDRSKENLHFVSFLEEAGVQRFRQ